MQIRFLQRYRGQWRRGQRHGYGTWHFQQCTYTGTFVQGARAQGELVFADACSPTSVSAIRGDFAEPLKPEEVVDKAFFPLDAADAPQQRSGRIPLDLVAALSGECGQTRGPVEVEYRERTRWTGQIEGLVPHTIRHRYRGFGKRNECVITSSAVVGCCLACSKLLGHCGPMARCPMDEGNGSSPTARSGLGLQQPACATVVVIGSGRASRSVRNKSKSRKSTLPLRARHSEVARVWIT